MSGIISLFNLDGEPISRSFLHEMTEFMAFRGPDDRKVWHNGKIGLGHTLLRTTFEQQREQQPFTLDNGVSADDAPDVELILHAYQVWDTACVDYLMGDFVFIIWDSRQQRLFCARDHFGILPLYYAQVNNTLICSNTLNCIRLHPQISAKLNEQAATPV